MCHITVKKISCVYFLTLLLMLFFIPVAIASDYGIEVVKDETYDIPIKTQVVMNIIVTGKINESILKDLLLNKHNEIKNRTGFKYHEHPTNIYIYIFDSEEKANAGQGLWLAMSSFVKDANDQPEIDVNKERINSYLSGPTEKHGLSEEIRKQIFKEYVGAEDRAMSVAESKYPNDFMAQAELMNQLTEKYKKEVAKKYNLSEKQLKEIASEGVEKGWPMPKL